MCKVYVSMPGFLAGPAEVLLVCLCLGTLWFHGARVSMWEMLVSRFWKGSLQGSLQSLGAECT